MNKIVTISLIIALAFCSVVLCGSSESDAASEYDARSTITFDPNGGYGSIPSQKVLSGNTMELPASGFSRNGYYLSGWSSGSVSGAHLDPGSEYAVADDIVLYAEWTVLPDRFDECAVSSVKEGTGYSYTPYSDYNDTNDKPAWTEFAVNFMMYSQDSMYECTVVREDVPQWMDISVGNGYIVAFSGTCHVPGVYAIDIRLNIDGPAGFEKNFSVSWIVTVVPEHQNETFSLSFDGNGGDGSVPSMSAQYANGLVLPSDGFSRDGYTLVGWKISVDGTEATFPLGSVYTIRSDTAAKAHWIADPNIIVLDANGGASTDYTAFIAQTDGVIALPSGGFEMRGCTLSGWYDASDPDSVMAPGFMITVTGPMTFKAYWTDDSSQYFTVRFESDGGYGSVMQKVGSGKSVVLPQYGFSKTDMELVGWSRDGTAYQCNGSVPINGDTVFSAVWGESTGTVTVTFDLNGGYGSMVPKTVDKGSRISEPSDPARSAFVFKGWKQIGGTWWDFDDPVQYSITLQAEWSQHYTIERNQRTVTLSVTSEWSAFGTEIQWGDGTESEGYGTMYSHTYSDDITAHINVRSVNGGTVEGESSITVTIGTGVPSHGGNEENDDNSDENRDDRINLVLAAIIILAICALIAMAVILI